MNGFLKADKKGSIVNIASVASFKGFANGEWAHRIRVVTRIVLIGLARCCLHCLKVSNFTFRHGLIGLTKNTAAFYRLKGIRCNAICAGAMQTNIGSNLANGFNMDGMMLMKQTCECSDSFRLDPDADT